MKYRFVLYSGLLMFILLFPSISPSYGDGLGYGSSQSFCSAGVSGGWVLNNDDEDDNCYSNYHDCAGVCDGEGFIQSYFYDLVPEIF